MGFPSLVLAVAVLTLLLFIDGITLTQQQQHLFERGGKTRALARFSCSRPRRRLLTCGETNRQVSRVGVCCDGPTVFPVIICRLLKHVCF